MACERKLLESEATTGFFVLLVTKGKKETLEWCMKANLIASRYECPRCKKEMRLQERKGTVDGYEWRCRSQSKDNPHDVVRSVLDESRSLFRVHTGYFSNIPKCIKAEFIASWACSQSSVVSSSQR
ncbi:uncharacterized protein TNCV_1838461 [Trichonephila clavipes]|nr:uncharacterized protein TNCV_1838461 [Trichonephila clavipes]